MINRRRLLPLTLPFLAAVLLLVSLYLIVGLIQPVQANNVPGGGLVIGPNALTKNANPEEVVTYTNIITNLHTHLITVTIDYFNEEGWTVITSTRSLTVERDLTETVVVAVIVPDTAIAGSVTTVVTATNSEDPDETDTANNVTIVNALPEMEMTAQDNTLSGDPDQNLSYHMVISNTGNADDTYNIEVASGAQSFPTSSQPTITVNAGQSDNFDVSVEIPGDTEADISDIGTVTATSGISPSLFIALNFTTTVESVGGVTIVPDDQSKNSPPGNTVIFNHTITNTGNAADDFSIQASPNLPNFTINVEPSSILNLARGDSEDVEISVQVATGTPSDTVNTTIVTVTSTLIDPTEFDTASDKTTVTFAAGVEIEKDETGAGDPGTTVQYVHTVTNTGNGVDTFDILVDSSPGWASANVSSLRLLGGRSGNVTIDVDIPSGSDSTQVEVTTVTARSQKDPSTSDSVVDTTSVNRHLLFVPMITSQSTWRQVGENSWDGSNNTRALSVDVCSTNDDLIFAGTDSEIRIFDGNSWSPAGGNAPNGSLISGVVLNKGCNTVYAAVFAASESSAIPESGVWEGKLDTNGWVWTKLEGGVNVVTVRAIVLADGKLFAAGGFGIAYWDDNQWMASSIAAPDVVTDMTVADPVENEGPIYAIIWMDPKIYRNVDPGAQPGQFNTITGIGDLPTEDRDVLAVAGDANGVRYVGTVGKHLQLNGTVWDEVRSQGARAFSINGADFVGYINPVPNVPGDGVYVKQDEAGVFVPYNEGWGPPNDVVDLVNVSSNLYAATTEGVFIRRQ